MTRNEMIEIIFKIKEDPNGHDFSSYLYSAVGLLKRQSDAGTAYAALKLVDTIEKAVGGKENLSDFSQKRISQIEKLCTPAMARLLEKVSKAYEMEMSDEVQLRAMEEAERKSKGVY